MLQDKIEDAFNNKKIAKILLDTNKTVYGIFTGRINVVSSISDNSISYRYRYYFKEIDINEYSQERDIYKSTKNIIVIMQDQIADIQESWHPGFSKDKYLN